MIDYIHIVLILTDCQIDTVLRCFLDYADAANYVEEKKKEDEENGYEYFSYEIITRKIR